MNLKQGINIFKSEKGHRGFMYPASESFILSSDAEASILPWVGSEDKIAVMVEDETYAHTWKEKTVIIGPVWVSKSDIERGAR